MKGDKCVVCGRVEKQLKGDVVDEVVDGGPYIKGLVCHPCDDAERAKHAVQ